MPVALRKTLHEPAPTVASNDNGGGFRAFGQAACIDGFWEAVRRAARGHTRVDYLVPSVSIVSGGPSR